MGLVASLLDECDPTFGVQFLDRTRGALSCSKNTKASPEGISDGVPRVFVALAAVLFQRDGVLGLDVALEVRMAGHQCPLGRRSRATSTRGAVLERADSDQAVFGFAVEEHQLLGGARAAAEPASFGLRHSQQLGSRSNRRHFLHDARAAQGWAACRSGGPRIRK